MAFRLGIFGILIAALIGVMVFAYSILNPPRHAAVVATAASPAAAPAPPPTVQILTAAGPLPGGILLQPANIGSTSVVTSSQVPGELQDTSANRSALMGSMLRVQLAAGAPIMDNEVIHPGDHGFLAAVLPPGMTAVTIPVDQLTGTAGLIWPGDKIDLLMTQTLDGAPYAKSMTAAVVLTDVPVVATNATLVRDANAGPGGGSIGSVTLEVTPEQASECIIAENLGKLSLIVHSAQGLAKDGSDPDARPAPPVFTGNVSQVETSLSTVKVISSGGEGEFKF